MDIKNPNFGDDYPTGLNDVDEFARSFGMFSTVDESAVRVVDFREDKFEVSENSEKALKLISDKTIESFSFIGQESLMEYVGKLEHSNDEMVFGNLKNTSMIKQYREIETNTCHMCGSKLLFNFNKITLCERCIEILNNNISTSDFFKKDNLKSINLDDYL